MKNIAVTFSTPQWEALNKQIDEQKNHFARLVADGSAFEDSFREQYHLWKAIETAMLMDSNWIKD